MNRLTDESVQLSPRWQAEPKKRKLIDPAELFKRFILGVIGSFLFSALMFFVQIKAFIAFILAAVLTFLGWTTMPPKEIKDAGVKVVNHLKEEAKGHLPPVVRAGMMPSLPGSEEHMRARAEREEAARKRQLDTDRAKADALGIEWSEEWTHETFAVKIRLAEKAKSDAERQAKDDKKRAELIERATRVNFGVDADLELKEMERQVVEAERWVKADADFQLRHRKWEEAMQRRDELIATGPNANCPSCNFPQRLRTSNPTLKAYCPNCRFVTSRQVMLAVHRDPPAPPEPQPPKTNPGFLERFFRR